MGSKEGKMFVVLLKGVVAKELGLKFGCQESFKFNKRMLHKYCLLHNSLKCMYLYTYI